MPNYKKLYQIMLNSVIEAEHLSIQSAKMAVEASALANSAARILLDTLEYCENPFPKKPE